MTRVHVNGFLSRILVLVFCGCLALAIRPGVLPFDPAAAYACNGGGHGDSSGSHGGSSGDGGGADANSGALSGMGPLDHRNPPAGFTVHLVPALTATSGSDRPGPDLTAVVQSMPPHVHTIDDVYVSDTSTGSVGPTESVEYLEPLTEEQWEALQTFMEVGGTLAGSYYIGATYAGYEAVAYSAGWGAATTYIRSDGDGPSSATSAIQDGLIAASGAGPGSGALASEALGQIRDQIPERPSLSPRERLERLDDPRSRALP